MATDELHLNHAPIVEALISIDVEPLGGEQTSKLYTAGQTLKPEYPESEPLNQLQIAFGVTFQPSGISHQTSHQGSPYGHKFVSKDKRQLLLFRHNGFTFSRLPPYDRWDSFRSEARRIWNIYRDAVGPVTIKQFGLRYINRVLVPIGEPIERYLKLFPNIPDNPDGSPRTIQGSYMRVDSMLEEPVGQLIIQQAMLPMMQEGFATLSLDFDLRFQFESSTEDYVWTTLETARHIKNQLFVDSLTSTFLETFR